jgi:hypothetical protein
MTQYVDNDNMKETLNNISNNLIEKTEQLLQLYRKQQSLITSQFP